MVRKAGFADILQGLGGVVVRPDFFDDEAFDIPDILWAVDDVWLSGMLEPRASAPAKRLAAMGVEKKRFLQALDQAGQVDYRSRLGQVTAKTLQTNLLEFLR